MVKIPPPSFVVNYNALAFPSGVQPRGQLTFTSDDLAHALFATGRAPGDRRRYGAASTWEWLHRSSLIPAYVRRRPYGALTRSRLAEELDRSELVGLSYALGTAMAAVFCRQVLSVTHLLHIDRYAKDFGVVFASGRKRADLIGRSPAGWVVTEAKGRSRGMESALRAKLVAQKRSVLSIESAPPAIALGCVASFPYSTGGMVVDAFDPETPDEDAIRLDDLTLDRYLFCYYRPFINALESSEGTAELNLPVASGADEEGPFATSDFSTFRVRVGLLHEIVALTRHATLDDLGGYGGEVRVALASARNREVAMFPDGSTFETDWTNAVQTSDWADG